MFKQKRLLPCFLAFRYLTWSRADSHAVFIARLCFLGIMIGSASLCLTLMIMSGFEKEISQKARGINSQAIISAKSEKVTLSWPEVGTMVKSKFSSDIDQVSATAISQVVLDHGQNFYNLLLKAIDPKTFSGISDLTSRISPELSKTGIQTMHRKPDEIDLEKILKKNNVIIGHKLAKNLGLKLGDQLKVLLPEPVNKKKVKLSQATVQIAGFSDIGFSEYDSSSMICSLELFWEFFGHSGSVDCILVKFTDIQNSKTPRLIDKTRLFFRRILPWAADEETETIKKLNADLPGLKVISWKELYPALLSSMRLEKYAMFFILLLVSIVAVMNMISLLIVQVQAKRKDIAILKTIGFEFAQIQQIFIFLGTTLTFLASCVGILLSVGLGLFFSRIFPIALPDDAYLVTHLPFDMAPEHFLLVFLATMIVGFLASWIPARRVWKLNIVQVLRGQ